MLLLGGLSGEKGAKFAGNCCLRLFTCLLNDRRRFSSSVKTASLALVDLHANHRGNCTENRYLYFTGECNGKVNVFIASPLNLKVRMYAGVCVCVRVCFCWAERVKDRGLGKASDRSQTWRQNILVSSSCRVGKIYRFSAE